MTLIFGGWLAKTRVRHIRTGALGVVLGDSGRFTLYVRPLVRWDDGATMRVDARDLERSPDDWLLRAIRENIGY